MSRMTIIVCSVIILIICNNVSLSPLPSLDDNDIIKVTSPILKGALVDSYDKKIIVIRLVSPQDVIKDVISNIDFKRMTEHTAKELLNTLGDIEKHYQNQFTEILGTYQELIVSPYPVEEENRGNGQLLDLKGLRRSKRSWRRALFAILRAVRPVARTAGKLTRYGRFMKGLKYAGYAASTGVFAYEIADVVGAIPDLKYEEVTRQLKELHDSRVKDLEIIRNITLLTMNTNKNIKDIRGEVSLILADAEDKSEVMIKMSQVFVSYMQQLSNGFLLLLQGKIPSNMISLDLQRAWLEKQLPSPFLNHIGSITPHLRVVLKAIDEVNNQLLISVEVPKVNSKFQLLNYVDWEPKVIHNGICYTSPRTSLFLAYPSSENDMNIPLKPLLIDPESCLTDGYIMCESDAILDSIPLLSENKICTKSLIKVQIGRNKRDVEDLFFQATSPIYDISKIVNKTLIRNNLAENTQIDLVKLQQKLDLMIQKARDDAEKSKDFLKLAERDSQLIKILFLILTPIILCTLWFLIVQIKNFIIRKKTQQAESRRLRILDQVRQMGNN